MKFDVIVNVPTLQTNEPYSYAVDESQVDNISIGSRVLVPFGKANRPIQGFVVGIYDDNVEGLKNIISVMEPTPILNDELIELSNWMAKETFSFRISCINAMLPSIMKVNTRRYINIIDNSISKDELIKNFGSNQILDLNVAELSSSQQKLLNDLLKQGKISLEYEAQNQAKKKMINWIWPNKNKSELNDILEDLRPNAKQQNKLVEALLKINSNEGISQSKLIKNYAVTSATIASAVKHGWINRKEVEKYRDPFEIEEVKKSSELKLNSEQQNALNEISQAVEKHDSKPILLEGVTGSGKTEVYLQSIAKVIKKGKTAILLVPEISLTPLMVNRVRARFGKNVAVLHSGLSEGEKYDEWRKIRHGEVQVVVGARSAIFAPLNNIGIIIMDEEHSETYKQSDAPRYHARNVAIWRAIHFKCPLVLGSATPSLESRARAEKGVYKLAIIKKRANNSPLPTVQVVDMRDEDTNELTENFSTILIDKIKEKISKKEQIVLMMNRRGYSSFVMCRTCGFVLKCPNCDVSLTLHYDSRTMKCHYCGHEEPIPNKCRNCGSNKIRFYGSGTQKIQKQLEKIFPEAKIIRMDVDTTRKKGSHQRLLDRFGNHEADILLGTQMIAKGLDFPDVTLVGVLNADTALELPDLRASEKTFQLLTQVAGRAGRADKPGEVIIQTFNPDHYAIKLAQQQDYEDFFYKEMYLRHLGKYPPYYFTVMLRISNFNKQVALKTAIELTTKVKKILSKKAIILGPTEGSIAKIKQQYNYQILIKYTKEPLLSQVLNDILTKYQMRGKNASRVAIDSDPQNFV